MKVLQFSNGPVTVRTYVGWSLHTSGRAGRFLFPWFLHNRLSVPPYALQTKKKALATNYMTCNAGENCKLDRNSLIPLS